MTVERENHKKQEYLLKREENSRRKISTGSDICTGFEKESGVYHRERTRNSTLGKVKKKDKRWRHRCV